MFKSAEETDWQSSADQQTWFERFAIDTNGIKFSQFQSFLGETLYTHFARFPSKDKDGPTKFSYQQEFQLFKMFDTKNDHVIDKEEFVNLCQNWLVRTYEPSCALVVVDVQNDFIDGSLALINGPAGEDGAEVVPVINRIISDCRFNLIAYTLDWHPPNHIGFHSNLHLRKYCLKQQNKHESASHLGTESKLQSKGDPSVSISNNLDHDQTSVKTDDIQQAVDIDNGSKFKLKKLAAKVKVFDTVLFDEGRMEQKLWPVHCVQNSWGAQLHSRLHRAPGAIYVEKGTLPNVDAYSAFWDNMHLNETGLRQELLSRRISDVFFCGLALDYCVAASALDSVKAGFVTFVIIDACRGIDCDEMAQREDEMRASGILIVDSQTVKNYLLNVKPSKFDASKNDGGRMCKRIEAKPASDPPTLHNHSPTAVSDCLRPISDNHSAKKEANQLDRSLLISVCYKRAVAVSSGLF